MKLFFQITTLCVFLLGATNLSAQWSGATNTSGDIYRTGKVGVGVNSVPSIHQFHVETGNLGDNTAAIYGEVLQPLGPGDRVRCIQGRIESGTGWTYGVYGSSYTQTPSAAGRSFGVFGLGGNSTAGANYGGFFQLSGSNEGVALLAVDGLNPDGLNWIQTSGLVDANRHWAGYFIGDVNMDHNLGIGCKDYTAPSAGTAGLDYRLFVNGGIRALEVHIDNASWCDYVFDKDYELTPLEAVATHIETKGHLHNTPSAEEIETNGGFELSEMTRNQQEKIEEIFLHLIELNKEVETLKAENAELKAALATKE